MIKIAFYGKSGVGKSTIATAAKEYFEKEKFEVEVIKLAYPLYYIQNIFYKIAGKEEEFYAQNQGLLEDIAKNLRKIDSQSIINNFYERYRQSKAQVVINDDVRETKVDYPFMKKEGFVFVKVECEEHLRINRLLERNDLDAVVNSKTTDYIDEIKPDYIINTSNDDKQVAREQLFLYLNEIRGR